MPRLLYQVPWVEVRMEKAGVKHTVLMQAYGAYASIRCLCKHAVLMQAYSAYVYWHIWHARWPETSRALTDGEQRRVVDGIDRAVHADQGRRIGFPYARGQHDVLSEGIRGEVPPVQGPVLAVHQGRFGKRIHHGGVDAPFAYGVR